MTANRCREVRELLAAFLDDELPCDLSRSIQEHLDLCDGCGGFARLERGFTSALRARLGRVEAPASLLDGALARLQGAGSAEAGGPEAAGASAPSGWWPRLRRRGFGLAAALLAAVLLAPAVELYVPGTFHGVWDSLTGVRRVAGVLVCVECEKKGASLEHQRRCRVQGHQTGIKVSGTGLWYLVANEASLPVISDPALRGKPVVVEGRFLSSIHYVDARSVTFPSGT